MIVDALVLSLVATADLALIVNTTATGGLQASDFVF